MSRELAQVLGGDLRLESSQPGKGSCFVLTIIAGAFDGDLIADTPQPSQPELTKPYIAKGTIAGKRVLVVEDSEDNQVLIQRYLNSAGLEVDLACNSEEGIARAERGDYDLVVMDIQMPGVDGHEATRTLRSRGFRKPIIALTAHAFKEERDRAFASGFTDYLTKPINRNVLLNAMTRELNPNLH